MIPNNSNDRQPDPRNMYNQYNQNENLQYPAIPTPYPFDPRLHYPIPLTKASNYQVVPPNYPQYPMQFNSAYPQPYPVMPPGMMPPPQDSLLKNFAMIGDIIKKMDSKQTEQHHRDSKERRHHKIKKREKEVKLGNIVFKPSKGDWQCPVKTCQNWNYAKRQKCNLCGSGKDGYRDRRDPNERFTDPKPELKSQSPREGDWKCVKCGFGNYQYKEECYRCSEPKPVTKNDTSNSKSA